MASSYALFIPSTSGMISEASGGERGGRVLTDEDIGRVFVRVDPNGDPDEYLRLHSMGAHPNQIASFISFRIITPAGGTPHVEIGPAVSAAKVSPPGTAAGAEVPLAFQRAPQQ